MPRSRSSRPTSPAARLPRVVRLCSVYEPPAAALAGRGARLDPIGGMQNHAAQLSRALAERGVRQDVITARRLHAPLVERPSPGIRVFRVGLPVPWLRQLYAAPAAALAAALAARADLVHAHLGEDLALLPMAVAAARLHRLPLVVTVHTSLRHTFVRGDLRSTVLERVGGPIEGWGVRRADALIALTPRLARLATAEGLPAARVHVIPSGVNGREFADAHPDPFPDVPRPRVVFVGRLAHQKGVGTLVAAAERLRTAATVLVVGDGPQRRDLSAAVRRAGLEGRVRFTGFVPHERVPAVLRHADVLALPSVYEELGSVLLEALEAGVPVVASDTGGISHALGDAGLLVPPGDPEALAAALDRVLGDAALARSLRDRARRRARGYDWDVLAGRVLQLYRDVAGRPAIRVPPAAGPGGRSVAPVPSPGSFGAPAPHRAPPPTGEA